MRLRIIKNSSSGFWVTLNDKRFAIAQLIRGGPEKYLYRWCTNPNLPETVQSVGHILYPFQNLGALKESIETWVNQQPYVYDYRGRPVYITEPARFPNYDLHETQVPSDLKEIRRIIES